jgi:hypothetical protein
LLGQLLDRRAPGCARRLRRPRRLFLLLPSELLDEAAVHLKVLVLEHLRVQELLKLPNRTSRALFWRRKLASSV